MDCSWLGSYKKIPNQTNSRVGKLFSGVAIEDHQQRSHADECPEQHSLNGGFPSDRVQCPGRKAGSDEAKEFGDSPSVTFAKNAEQRPKPVGDPIFETASRT